MRLVAGCILVACTVLDAAQVQFKSTVPLVIAPTTVTDATGTM